MVTYFGSDGFRLYEIKGNENMELLQRFALDSLKTYSIAEHGHCVALLDDEKLTCLNVGNNELLEIPVVGASNLILSPCGRIVFTYASFYRDREKPQHDPNVRIFSTDDGHLIDEYIFPHSDGWQPHWTSDSSLCAVCSDGAINIYLSNQFGSKPAGRLVVKGMRHFSLSTCSKDPNLAVYIPGQKGQPSFVRIYQWRDGQCGQIANRSFYRADAVQLFWNDRGTDLLVLASTKMSDESYYGDQSLYYLTTRKSTNSAVVTMPRKGPIYQVAWKPSPSNSNRRSSEEFFAVCHGDVPASVTVFGLECEPVFDFGAGSWNQIHFNPHGNLILAAGLGGMNGDIAVWDFDRHELLSRFSTTDVTNISWLNDGEHLILATTTPRLRVNNSFGIWHYSGKKLYFQRVARRAVPRPATMDLPAATEHELYRIQVVPQLKLPPAPKPKKFSTSVELPAAPKKYVPPALRNRSEVAKQAMAAAHMEDTMKLTYRAPIVSTLPIGLNSSALNPGKKSKSTKCKTKMSSTGSAPAADTSTTKAPSAPAEDRPCQSDEQLQRTKQIAQLKKKLIQIEKLKAEQASGKQLAFNQLDKLATEEELRAHLNRLSVSSGDTANCV